MEQNTDYQLIALVTISRHRDADTTKEEYNMCISIVQTLEFGGFDQNEEDVNIFLKYLS